MNTQNPGAGPAEPWPPPLCPHLQELFDAADELIHPSPEEEARMRRDLAALLAAEERRIRAEQHKKEARKRTAFRAAVGVLLVAAVVSALAVTTVATVVAIREVGPRGNAGAPLVKMPPPAEPAGTATPGGPRAPRRVSPK